MSLSSRGPVQAQAQAPRRAVGGAGPVPPRATPDPSFLFWTFRALSRNHIYAHPPHCYSLAIAMLYFKPRPQCLSFVSILKSLVQQTPEETNTSTNIPGGRPQVALDGVPLPAGLDSNHLEGVLLISSTLLCWPEVPCPSVDSKEPQQCHRHVANF